MSGMRNWKKKQMYFLVVNTARMKTKDVRIWGGGVLSSRTQINVKSSFCSMGLRILNDNFQFFLQQKDIFTTPTSL